MDLLFVKMETQNYSKYLIDHVNCFGMTVNLSLTV